MGITNREYYRSEQESRFNILNDWQGWQWIMGITIAVYVLQILSYSRQDYGRFQSIVTNCLSLKYDELLAGQVWRTVSYAFCHDEMSLWHLLMNMLALWFFGREIEIRTGKWEFISFYLLAAIISGLGHIVLAMLTPYQPSVVGASGSTTAILVLFALWYPELMLQFMFFPVQARTLALILVGMDAFYVVAEIAQQRSLDSVAHGCHLAGAIFGFIYGYYAWNITGTYGHRSWTSTIGRKPRRKIVRTKHVRLFEPEPEDEPLSNPQAPETKKEQEISARVDEILKKIFDHGEPSLTPEERQIMQQASKLYQQKNQ